MTVTELGPARASRLLRALAPAILILAAALAAGCGIGATRAASTVPTPSATAPSPRSALPSPRPTPTPCTLTGVPGSPNAVPIDQVCSSVGAPDFATPDAAMTYLASAWNAHDVAEIDYVTDPAGRAQMDSMAAAMVNLQFKSCTANPAGDYTCYFMHDIAASSTSYPNPQGYPPGEAVFTVAPAAGPGWYLTEVEHCG